jgi:hypothetical protein
MADPVAFEQEPGQKPGAGFFHLDSGEKRYAYLPEVAAQLPPPGQAAAPPPAPAPNRFASAVADAAAENAAAAPPPGPVAPPPGPAQEGPPGAPATPQDDATRARNAVTSRTARDLERGYRETIVPGSPGVDPAKMRASGSYVPTGGHDTIETSGKEYNADDANARIEAGRGVLGAQLNSLELDQRETQNRLNAARAAAPALAQRAQEAEQAQQAVQRAYRTDRAKLQQDLDDYDRTAHIDPSKYFKDRGAFGAIGAMIAQAMGAYASSQTGVPNIAYEMIQKGIDRDISAQRDEIENGRVSRRNKMAQMMDNYGYDLPQAEAAMRIAMTKSAENEATQFAAESKLPHYQAEAEKLKALFVRDTIKDEQALESASIGKHTRTVNEQFLQPRAATGPTVKRTPLTPGDEKTLLGNLPATEGQDVKDLDPKARQELIGAYGKKKSEFADARAAQDDEAAAYGYKIDRERGILVDPKTGAEVDPNESRLGGSNPNIQGTGWSDPEFLALESQEAKRTKEARANAQAKEGVALSGASVAPEQQELIKTYRLGDDDASALRGLGRAVKLLASVESATDASYDPGIRSIYDRQKRAIERAHKTAPGPVKMTPHE